MANRDTSEISIDLERLLFRRQFLLGPTTFTPNQHWSSIPLDHELHLSVHADLPFCSASEEGRTVTLIGHAIDPYQPEATESVITGSLVAKAFDLTQLLDSTAPFMGRWVIICQNRDGTYLFTDPFGFRQVFYHVDGKQFWCASQPELIKANCQLSLSTNHALMNFLTHPGHVHVESQWIGPSTIYENCFHLLPNHYLSVDRGVQVRFYPSGSMPSKTTAEIVRSVSEILQGTMVALTSRYEVRLALTAGLDSRILLAASRHVSKDIEYFVYRQRSFTDNHPDIWVPRRIAKKLGLKFVIYDPGEHLPGWFVSMLSHNVTCARVLPKTRDIYDKLVRNDNRININGNGSETCRNYFDKYRSMDTQNVSTAELATIILRQEAIPAFATQELNKWINGLQLSPTEGLNVLDILYWEQRLGNWGAQYPAEQDIAVEELSPFNCRSLIQALLAAPRHLRAAPDYPLQRALIQEMWPEALAFPINPLSRISIVSDMMKQIRPYIPSMVAYRLKKLLKV